MDGLLYILNRLGVMLAQAEGDAEQTRAQLQSMSKRLSDLEAAAREERS